MNGSNNKFLFDLNNFDPPAKVEIEEDIIEFIEPPPTFSIDELEAAKSIAYQEGLTTGHREEKQNRDQYITDVLYEIKNSFGIIFANELYRERVYEQEAVHLSLKVIETLYPSLNDYLGALEIINSIETTIKNQTGQTEIRLEVPTGTSQEINSLFKKMWPDPDTAPRYKIIETADMGLGHCALSWKDGGMVRNPAKTAEQIKIELEDLLLKNNGSIPDGVNNDIKNQGFTEISGISRNGINLKDISEE